MYQTHHEPMRTRLIPRQRGEQGCIRPQRPGRNTERYAALREQEALR